MVFLTCVLKILNHFMHFLLRNSELNVKQKRVSRQRGVAYCLKISRPMLEKHGSPRNKITGRFRDLISREFSPRIRRKEKNYFVDPRRRIFEAGITGIKPPHCRECSNECVVLRAYLYYRA